MTFLKETIRIDDILKDYQTIIVGFSGGVDSTVLLHLIVSNPELRSKTRAIHINHGLSPHADVWQEHCETFCKAWDIPLITHKIVLSTTKNIEEEARKKRYAIFAQELPLNGSLVLGHHEDDQAETLLLQLVRGAGVRGLSGISAELSFKQGVLLRPLLTYARQEIESYALQENLTWIEDESNENTYFSRNHIRHVVMPAFQEKWPEASRTIAQCARHMQMAQDNLQALAEIDCPALKTPTSQFTYTSLLHLNESRLMNVVLTWLYRLGIQPPHAKTNVRILRELIGAAGDKEPLITWGAYTIRRYQDTLYVTKETQKEKKTPIQWSNFPNPLIINEKEFLVATPSMNGVYIPPNSEVEVRFRVGGEKIRRHHQTQSLKKILQAHQIEPWRRFDMPLLYVNHELVLVVDFLMRDPYDEAKAPYIYQIERRTRDALI